MESSQADGSKFHFDAWEKSRSPIILPKKMESKLETWATARLSELTAYLGLSPADISSLVNQALDMPESELYDFFFGILGDEALQFVQTWNELRKPKQVLQGIWKTTGMDLETQLVMKLNIDVEAASKILLTAEGMEIDKRREYFQDLMGPGFETERFLILYNKLLDKKRKDEEAKKNNSPPPVSKSSQKKKKKLEKEQQAIGQIGNLKPRVGDRPICECMASVHPLLCNCLYCGKILCAFEGDEICCWCGKVPQRDYITTNPGAFESAKLRAQRLLDYQANSAQRTHVYDNAADFDVGNDRFNKWASLEEREIAAKRLEEKNRADEESKSRRVMTLDLVNNKVIYEKAAPVEIKTQLKEKEKEVIDTKSSGLFRNPHLEKKKAPVFIPSSNSSGRKSKKGKPEFGPDDIKRLEQAITDLEV